MASYLFFPAGMRLSLWSYEYQLLLKCFRGKKSSSLISEIVFGKEFAVPVNKWNYLNIIVSSMAMSWAVSSTFSKIFKISVISFDVNVTEIDYIIPES